MKQRVGVNAGLMRACLEIQRVYLSFLSLASWNGVPSIMTTNSANKNGIVISAFQNSVSSIRRGSATLTPRCASPALTVQDSKDAEYRKVLVLYTGGTIGMVRNNQGGKSLRIMYIISND